MAKKIKKMAKQMQIIDPNLEEVEEEHSFEIEYDEETNEALLVHHLFLHHIQFQMNVLLQPPLN